jgi:hypothetical protein
MTYRIRLGNGNIESSGHLTAGRACDAAARKRGWRGAYASHWFAIEGGEACCIYETKAECDADQDGAHAIRIERY